MRTIVFKREEYGTDPVRVGDILRIRRGNKWYTAIATNEEESSSCAGCLFYDDDDNHCNVPLVRSSLLTICSKARCIFKDFDKVLEDL